MRRRILLSICAALLFALAFAWNGLPASQKIVSVMAGQDASGLRERVERLAREYAADPVDARNDPVWKAVPGLNGVEVDVEETLKRTAGNSRGKIEVAAKQIPPRVSLDDLGALPIYRGNPAKKQMSLMINVAWGTEYLDGIMETLDTYKVKATFFLDGSWTAKNGAMAKAIAARGHEIGNHAYTHPDMAQLDAQRTVREIVRTSEVIARATGVRPKLFAPPSGSYSDTTVAEARKQGLRTILWTHDTIDWKKPPASEIVTRIMSRAESGALVLMHPTEPTSAALRTLIPGLLGKGYGLVTVSELLSEVRPLPAP